MSTQVVNVHGESLECRDDATILMSRWFSIDVLLITGCNLDEILTWHMNSATISKLSRSSFIEFVSSGSEDIFPD